jgi:hypothetical protein
MIFILIIILLIIFYIYYNNKYENFTSEINSINMDNIFNQQRLLNDGKQFEIYNKDQTKIRNDFYNANIELDNHSLQNILNLFINNKKINTNFQKKKNYEYQYGKKLDIPFIDKKIYEKIKKKIIDDINRYLLRFISFSSRKFSIVDDTILNYRENKEYIKIIFFINIYRKDKYQGFQVYCLSYFNKKKKEIILKTLKVSGNISSQELYLLPGYEKNSEKYNIYSSCFPYTKYDASKSYVRSAQNERILPSKNQVKEIIDERKKNRIIDFLERSYNCYGSNGKDIYNCKSDKNGFGLYKPPGIWDRPCHLNDECPFYKANKNYPNRRGGCIKGVCEMPLNVENLTWRMFNKLTKPFCYNCKGKNNDCCKIQMKNYSKILSPDYAFVGDNFERYKYRKDLKDKGLGWNVIK